MAKHRFMVDAPEQLKELDGCIIIGGLASLATVWSADRRKNGGTSKWDGKIFVDFNSDKNNPSAVVNYRHAYVGRVCANGKVNEEATLHYNRALQWCKVNLKPWDNSNGDV